MIELQVSGTHGKRLFGLVVLGILLAVVVFLGFKYVAQASELRQLQQQTVNQHTNVRVVNFLQLFIEKVLKSDQPVSFEDRLRLENAIRDIDDPAVLQKWDVFINASTEAEIQGAVKDLLQDLVAKISY